MQAADTAIWRVSPDVRATYSEDGAVLLDINKGLCYSLNVVGSHIWVSIESSPFGIDLTGIVTALETHFQVPHQQLEADATEYLNKLEGMGLVHHNGAATLAKAERGGR
jgi:Coenzyme PQQ synthesis protein D (PqqD)